MIYLVTNNAKYHSNKLYQIISVEESLEKLNKLKLIGLDTETSGLDCHTDKLLALQLGCFDFQVVIDCLSVDVNNYKELLESKDHLFLGWNLKFDLKFLFKHRIVPLSLYDGMIAEQLLYLGYPEGMFSASLKTASWKYIKLDMDKSIRGQISFYGLIGPVIKYAADDVKYLEQIILKQREELVKKELLRAIDIENKFLLPISYTEFCGVRIDIKKWEMKIQEDNDNLINATRKCNEWIVANADKYPELKLFFSENSQSSLFASQDVNPPGYTVHINWKSPQQVVKLFNVLGLDLTTQDKKTKKLKDSVEEKILIKYAKECELVPIYLEYAKYAKATSTYGKKFLDQINPKTGRLYTNYKQLGTNTTRISSGGNGSVNFLNLPADEFTRSCFIAEDTNNWISIDYSG